METGTFNWFGYVLPLAQQLEAIANAGFDAVMLWWGDSLADYYGTPEQRARMVERSGLAVDSVHPVSYTHLDVYKRQGLRPELCQPFRLRLKLCDATGCFSDRGGPAGSGHHRDRPWTVPYEGHQDRPPAGGAAGPAHGRQRRIRTTGPAACRPCFYLYFPLNPHRVRVADQLALDAALPFQVGMDAICAQQGAVICLLYTSR